MRSALLATALTMKFLRYLAHHWLSNAFDCPSTFGFVCFDVKYFPVDNYIIFWCLFGQSGVKDLFVYILFMEEINNNLHYPYSSNTRKR